MSTDFLDAIPVLPYLDIRSAHDFLVDVIGLDSAGLVEQDGRLIRGEVQAGGRRFWLHESADALTSPDAAGVRTGGRRATTGTSRPHWRRPLFDSDVMTADDWR